MKLRLLCTLLLSTIVSTTVFADVNILGASVKMDAKTWRTVDVAPLMKAPAVMLYHSSQKDLVGTLATSHPRPWPKNESPAQLAKKECSSQKMAEWIGGDRLVCVIKSGQTMSVSFIHQSSKKYYQRLSAVFGNVARPEQTRAIASFAQELNP